MNSIWLMTSAEYAGDTSLFVGIQNVLLRENGGIFMLTSLGLIFLLGLLMAAVCQRIHLPRIIGMLLTGIILGPYVLDLLDVSILNISSELRQIALIIILLKAGLSLDLKDLKKVGRSAVMLACVPATCELLAFVIFAPMILNISRVDAAVMGAVLAAVSPAVVVPRMVHLMENSYGTEKSIPQMILAGASCDDIYVIVLFSTFVGMAQGGQVNALDFVNIPVSILTGVLFGALVGWLLGQLFDRREVHLQNEDGSVSEEIKERTYDLKSRGQGRMIQVSIPASVPLKEFDYNAEVELINPVADTVATATFQGAEVDWYIKAEDIVLKKGAAMNPQPPKKDVPPAK